MKVRIQSVGTSTNGSNLTVIPYTINGFRSLYHGVHIPLITAGIMQSINFGVYDSWRRYWIREYPGGMSHLTSVFLGGYCSGLVTSIISTPIQLLKTQLQTHRNLRVRDILMRDVYHTGRWRILYRGLAITATADAFGRGIYLYSYEAAKATFAEFTQEPPSLYTKILSASFAGVSSWFIMFPVDTLKTLVQSTYDGPSAMQHLKVILRSGRARAILYRGCLYAVIRAAPVAATILPLYDACYTSLLSSLGDL